VVTRHYYEGERCIYCGVNIYDQWIYGAVDESDCVEREPMVYTSEAGGNVSKEDDYDSCPGYEVVPNKCKCPCEGCKYNCGAHEEKA